MSVDHVSGPVMLTPRLDLYKANILKWLAVSQPDIVMMQLGTNDVWSSLSTSTILAAYTTLVGQMRAQNPKVLVLVAQITPMSPSGCTTCAQGVIDLNAAIPAVRPQPPLTKTSQAIFPSDASISDTSAMRTESAEANGFTVGRWNFNNCKPRLGR